MGRFHGIWANLIGALLGTVTPFCSCSSIPIFMGFTSAGLPLGVTFSFLISSPMVDLGSLILLMSVFGGKIAFAYVIVGLVIAVIGGTIIERLHMEDQVADFIRQAPNVEVASPSLTIADRMDYAKNQVVATVKKEMCIRDSLYTPCVAAIASIKRELGGKWAIGVVIFQCVIAWVAAFIVHGIVCLF